MTNKELPSDFFEKENKKRSLEREAEMLKDMDFAGKASHYFVKSLEWVFPNTETKFTGEKAIYFMNHPDKKVREDYEKAMWEARTNDSRKSSFTWSTEEGVKYRNTIRITGGINII